MPRILTGLNRIALQQVGHLFPWLPVLFGAGIATNFGLRFEPDRLAVVLAGLACGLAILAVRSHVVLMRAALIGAAAFSAGFTLATLRSHQVAENVLTFRYYGPLQGRIVGIDKSASDAVRLTLDRVVLRNMSPDRTPARVRVALHGDQSHFEPEPGQVVMMAANLAPPSGPVEPGGFDFQRHAWFQRLGGQGYTRTPVMVLEPTQSDLAVFRLRRQIGKSIRKHIPGPEGAFAVAVITGDRSEIAQRDLDSLRASNLAHLLAISGLHMGMLAGLVFGAIRGGLALVPRAAMQLPAKKIAAVGALIVATFYLILSGGAIATERAYVMVLVALIAVLMDRRAISLRAVAVAALIVLILTPEAVISPGFQMSFAATTALVGTFSGLRDAHMNLGPKWVRPVTTLVLSSAVAGLATAPFGAAHFNQVAQYGLLANLAAVPVMGLIVVPGAVLAALLAPFGWGDFGLALVAFGLRWILAVSNWIAAFPASTRSISQPDAAVLPLISLGGLWLILLVGRARWLGLGMLVSAMWLWHQTARPYILIADNGGLVGVMTDQGRALSRARGSSFVASVWLENDGDPSTQAQAHELWRDQVWHITGKKTVAKISDCPPAVLLVVNAPPPDNLACTVISPELLRTTGSIAISAQGQMTTSRDVHGVRIWHPWSRDQ